MTNIDTTVTVNGEPYSSDAPRGFWAKAWSAIRLHGMSPREHSLEAEVKQLRALAGIHEEQRANALRIAEFAGSQLEPLVGPVVRDGISGDAQSVIYSNEDLTFSIGVFSGVVVVQPFMQSLSVVPLVLKTKHARLDENQQRELMGFHAVVRATKANDGVSPIQGNLSLVGTVVETTASA